MHFLFRVLVLMASMGVVSFLIPGFRFESGWTLFWAALVVGLANAVLRPVLIFFTLPLVLLTLGLFVFVINAFLLHLAAWLVPGFTLPGFGLTLVAALLISIVSFVLNRVLTDIAGLRG